MFSIEQIQSFTNVYEHGSYSAAARIAGKERSTVREHILALEDIIGVKLFDIEGRRATPTLAADKLIIRSRNLNKQAADFHQTAMRLYQAPLSQLIIWHDEQIPTQFLAESLIEIQKKHPHIEIECRKATRQQAYIAVEEEQCHIAIMAAEYDTQISPKIASKNIGSILMDLYAHPQSRLAQASQISLEDLQLEPQYHLQHSMPHDLGVFRVGNMQHKVSSLELAVNLLAKNGWIMLPDVAARPWLAQGKLTKLNFDHLSRGHKREVCLYYCLAGESQLEVHDSLNIFDRFASCYLY